MTWIGKILTILVMLVSLVWMFLNVQTYVTRTNWKVEATKNKEAFDKAVAAREADYRAGLADRDSMKKDLDRYRTDLENLAADVKSKEKDLKDQQELYATLNGNFQKLNADLAQSTANLAASLEQVSQLRGQNDTLENSRVQLVREREKANIDKQQATNEKNAALSRVDQLTKEKENLLGEVYSLKQSGGREQSAVARAIAPRVAPLPANIRGTVTKVEGEFVELSIGLDAGLTPGAVLDLSRYTPDPKYLGKVTVTTIIEPKRAVASFQSSSKRPAAQLRPDELPRVNDVVGMIAR